VLFNCILYTDCLQGDAEIELGAISETFDQTNLLSTTILTDKLEKKLFFWINDYC
jgi:hypothetical protein